MRAAPDRRSRTLSTDGLHTGGDASHPESRRPRGGGGVQSPIHRVLRTVAVTAISGVLAGFVVGGLGSRLAMRLSALIDRDAHGRITEAGEVVGRITLGGSLGLIIALGLAIGVIVGFLWTLTSPWLPVGPIQRRVSAFVVAAALGSRLGIDGGNIDFRILDPAIAHAGVFVLLAGLAGVAAAMTEDKLLGGLTSAPGVASTVASSVVVAIGALITVPLAQLFFDDEACGCVSPPRLVGIAIGVLGVLWLIRFVMAIRGRRTPRGLTMAARFVLVGATASGFAHLGGEIAHFV